MGDAHPVAESCAGRRRPVPEDGAGWRTYIHHHVHDHACDGLLCWESLARRVRRGSRCRTTNQDSAPTGYTQHEYGRPRLVRRCVEVMIRR
jgi:hypothetical protein